MHPLKNRAVIISEKGILLFPQAIVSSLAKNVNKSFHGEICQGFAAAAGKDPISAPARLRRKNPFPGIFDGMAFWAYEGRANLLCTIARTENCEAAMLQPSHFPGVMKDDAVLPDAARVRFLVLDVDGVCTDGKLYVMENGHSIKCFHAHDGLGIKTALRSGLGIGVITGRDDPCVHARMAQLGVTEYHPGHEAKLQTILDIMRRNGLEKQDLAYLGDDWIDLDPMRMAGMPMAVANARAQVKQEARYVTSARGGEGAVREAIELILYARKDGKNPAELWTATPGPSAL